MTFKAFAQLAQPAAAVIHSLEQALYQVTVVIGGEEHLLVENDGKTFRRHNLQQVREALQAMPVASLVLRQQSAYDEMIGQPLRETSNALEVPLSLEQYPAPSIH